MRARRDRNIFRLALVTAQRRAAEELMQAGGDSQMAASISRESKRLGKLRKELKTVEAIVRRAVATRLRKGWLGVSRSGTGELRREMKAIREERKDASGGSLSGRASNKLMRRKISGALTPGGRRRWDETWRVRGNREECGAGNQLMAPLETRASDGLTQEDVVRACEVVEAVDDRSMGANAGGKAAQTIMVGTSELTTHQIPVAHKASATAEASNRQAGDVLTSTASPVSHWKVFGDEQENEREARRRILAREQDFAREVATHNFEVRNPSPLKCCVPGCGRTFTEDAHYQAHWAATAIDGQGGLALESASSDVVFGTLCHTTNAAIAAPSDAAADELRTTQSVLATAATNVSSSKLLVQRVCLDNCGHPGQARGEAGHPMLGGVEVASFHIVVRDDARDADFQQGLDGGGVCGTSALTTGFDLVAAYITRVWGHGQAYNTLHFWRAVNSWRRRHLTIDAAFVGDAIKLKRLFLDSGAPMPVSLPTTMRQELVRVLDALTAESDHDGEDRRGATIEGEGCGFGGNTVQTGDKFFINDGTKLNDVCVCGGAHGNHHDARFKASFVGAGQRQRRKKINPALPAPTSTSAIQAAVAAVAAATHASLSGLRPTFFDAAQWQALSHLSRVVGSGFWASDLGRRFIVRHTGSVQLKRRTAYDIVRLEVRYEACTVRDEEFPPSSCFGPMSF